jgi:hypothetical protein
MMNDLSPLVLVRFSKNLKIWEERKEKEEEKS